MRGFLSVCVMVLGTSWAAAQETPAPAATEPAMTMDRLGQIILALDPEANFIGNGIDLVIEDIPVIVIADPTANRMRAMVPIRSAQGLEPEELMRLMQANFDSALDARYAVARGRLWGTFIHPLSSLEKDQLISALIQTVNVARTYGQSYSGGALTFGGGDSNGIYQELFDELRKRGEAL
ncbi:hypothetical protein [Ascidiaceihabitans sp.]|uniref:hypothetical protein n=1 Tax=Ascidiaceihabitans sp. TaxID=1872644 RepID=UPI00329A1E81